MDRMRSGNRPIRSVVWTFFTQDRKLPQIAICNICKKSFSYKTSTTNLKRHMQSKHPTVQMKFVPDRPDPRNNFMEEEQQDMEHDGITSTSGSGREQAPSAKPIASNTPQPRPTLSCSSTSSTTSTSTPSCSSTVICNSDASTTEVRQSNITYPRQLAISSYIPKKIPLNTKKRIDNKLLNLFTEDFQPFSIVEDKGFKEFVKELNPSYALPCRKQISKSLIPAKYEECLTTTKNTLSNAASVCLTTDTWTSVNTDSFMAVTAHFIDEDFNMRSSLLQCAQFSGRHTAENLAEALNKIVSDWKLTRKIVLVVSDNASNITKAVNLLQWKHLGCFAHSLNLVVHSSLEKNVVVMDLLQKVRGIVSHFKRSTNSTEKLMTYQSNNNPGKPPLKLIQDVSTRWNSTFYMLNRFTLLEETVKATVALIDNDVTQLTNDEWRMAHELVKLLKPFETITRHVSGEKYATASIAIPLTLGLQDVCKKLLQRDYMPVVKEVAASLSKNALERFANFEKSNTLTLATFLDPRYKSCVFSEESTREDVKKRVISLVSTKVEEHNRRMKKPNPAPTLPNVTNTEIQESENTEKDDEDLSVYGFVKKCVNKHKPTGTKQSRAIIEVTRYLDEEILDIKQNPLDWWRNNKVDYPFLSKVVRDHFCVLCTSVPCERVFSKAGYMLSERRNRLTGKKAQQLMFLNGNASNQ